MVSTRRSQTDKNIVYKVGDKVEIVRPGSLDVGILLYKTDDLRKKSPNGRDSPSSGSGGGNTTHWIVSVEGNSDEEDVSERYLGRIIAAKDDEADNERGKRNSNSSPPTSAVELSDKDAGVKKAEIQQATKEVGVTTSAKAPSKTIHKKTNQTKVIVNNRKGQQVGTRASARQQGDQPAFSAGIDKVKKSKLKKQETNIEETVIKVKMLTGTLYLYRHGIHRRVEFVRTV